MFVEGGIIMQDKVLFSFLFAIYNYILERLLKQFQVTEETNINFTTILVFSRLLKQFQRKRRIEQASKQVIIIFAKETSSYVKGYNVSGGAHLRGLFSQPALCISRLTASRLLWPALCISRLSASLWSPVTEPFTVRGEQFEHAWRGLLITVVGRRVLRCFGYCRGAANTVLFRITGGVRYWVYWVWIERWE